MAILVLVSTILLFNGSKFGGSVLLENLTYQVALAVRQAQVYGIAVQRFGTNNFSSAYGMHFSLSDRTHYIMFADAVSQNGYYDCPTPGSTATCELVQTSVIKQNFRISDLCIKQHKSDLSETCGISNLDVVFIRPEPDAYITSNNNSAILSGVPQVSNFNQRARIELQSPQGGKMSVVIEATGQIAVVDPTNVQ